MNGEKKYTEIHLVFQNELLLQREFTLYKGKSAQATSRILEFPRIFQKNKKFRRLVLGAQKELEYIFGYK